LRYHFCFGLFEKENAMEFVVVLAVFVAAIAATCGLMHVRNRA
jgi:hypothetical protein